MPTDDRPLSSDRAAIERLYHERYGIYCSVSDIRIDASEEASAVAQKILEEIEK